MPTWHALPVCDLYDKSVVQMVWLLKLIMLLAMKWVLWPRMNADDTACKNSLSLHVSCIQSCYGGCISVEHSVFKWVDELLVTSVLKPSLGESSSWPYSLTWLLYDESFLVKQSHDDSPLISAISAFIWLDFYELFGLGFMSYWTKLLYNGLLLLLLYIIWNESEKLYMIILSTQEVSPEQPSAFQPRRQHALLWFSSHLWEMAQLCSPTSHRMTMKILLVLPKPTAL